MHMNNHVSRKPAIVEQGRMAAQQAGARFVTTARTVTTARADARKVSMMALLAAIALPAAALPAAAQAQSGAYAQGQSGAYAQGQSGVYAQRLPLTAVPPDAGRPEASPGNSVSPLGVSPVPGQNTTGSATTEAGGPPTPISPVPRVGLFPELGKTLLDAGFDFHGLGFDRVSNNASAGVRTHETNHLLAIAPALDVDLGKAAGITGGNIHAYVTFNTLRANEPNYVTDGGGVLVSNLQGTPALSGHYAYLSELTYEQRLLNDRLSIEAGQTSVFRYFFLPNSLDPLTHYSTTVVVDGNFPTVPFPTWGARATYKLDPFWYVQLGAFEDNYRASTNYPLTFGAHLATGAQVLTEVGYRSDFSNARYPANLEVGVEYDTRTGYSNAKGSPAPGTAQTTAANYPGGAVIYGQGLKTLWRGASTPGAQPANVNVYGSLSVAADKPQPINHDAMVGMTFTGLIPARPSDAFGIQARWQRLSRVEASYESRVHNFFAGRGSRQARDGFAFELIDSVQVTPAIAIRPLAEYFIKPDNLGDLRLGRPKSGFEFALFTVVSLGRLLGTSAKPF